MTLTTVSWAQGGGPPGALRPHMVAVVLPPHPPGPLLGRENSGCWKEATGVR